MTRLIHLVLLIALLLGSAPLAPAVAHAQDASALIGTPAPIPGFAVARNEAKSDFPNGIDFRLDATSETPIAALELMYHVPGIETLSVELPPFEAGATSLKIEHPIDLRAGELPPGLDVLYHWRITDENGDVVETPEQTVAWIDSRHDWTPLAGPRVTVYSYDGNAEFQQTTLDSAERTIDKLFAAYGFLPTQPIRIWSYTAKEDLYGALPPNSEPWIAGAAFPALHLIMAILPPGDDKELARVVPHEMTHQVTDQVTKNPFNGPPLWLNEGLAVYWQESGRDRFYTYALQAADSGELPPLRTLNGEFAYDSEGALTAYALSLSVVIYILDTWGDEGMAKLLATFREGVTYDDAVQQGLGVSFDELDRGWREDLKEKAGRLLASGSTRFGDEPAGGPGTGSSIWQELLMSAGTIVLGLALLISLLAGFLSLLRHRRRREAEDEDDEFTGVRWRDWPEGLDPPGMQLQGRSPGHS